MAVKKGVLPLSSGLSLHRLSVGDMSTVYFGNCAVKRGVVEPGRSERVAPGVVRQQLRQPDTRWTEGANTENLSQGQLRPSSLRGPGPRTPRARPPVPAGLAHASKCSGSKCWV